MGKLSDSLLSGSTGRTGRLVVANVSGVEILRVRPRKRTGAPTNNQLLIQNRMKLCYDFILSYKSYASQYFGYRVGMRSCYNLAVSNIMLAYKIDFTTGTIVPDYPEIMFSKGKLLMPTPVSLTSASPSTLTVEWFDNAGGDAIRKTDQLQLLYIAEGQSKSVFLEDVAERSTSTCDINLPPSMHGKNIHVWIAFRAQDRSTVSNSVYVGSVLLS